MKEQEEKALTLIENLIGEHFVNYSVQVLTEDGELCFCNSSDIVGKALITETLKGMQRIEEAYIAEFLEDE